jgi:hypothetical protein
VVSYLDPQAAPIFKSNKCNLGKAEKYFKVAKAIVPPISPCSIFQLRRWYNAAKTNAPTAPTAADSVGVAMPDLLFWSALLPFQWYLLTVVGTPWWRNLSTTYPPKR